MKRHECIRSHRECTDHGWLNRGCENEYNRRDTEETFSVSS